MSRIGYRVYGHQSPTSARNCKDTELMVDFGPASANRDAILAKTQTVKAQGYTPITYVIELAARDIAKEPGSRTLVLVSDGKETCPGDPCAAAKALAEADANLVIHTIGFNVDAAARFQLQCMARVARGTYSDATGAADLGARLGAVAAAKPAPPPKQTKTAITITKPKPGKLQIKNPDFRGHNVTDAESGKAFGTFHNMTFMDLPAGIYNVAFGPTVWRSVEIRPGETTTLDPGVLEVTNGSPVGHKVLDWETGVEVGTVSGFVPRLSVLPSTFTVMFGNARWDNIEIKAGEHKVLNPAVIVVNGASGAGYQVRAEDGTAGRQHLVVRVADAGAARQIHDRDRGSEGRARPRGRPDDGDQREVTRSAPSPISAMILPRRITSPHRFEIHRDMRGEGFRRAERQREALRVERARARPWR